MFDILSVVYEPELPLLKIQAQSIQKYVNHSEIRNIRIMVNDADIGVARSIDREWWGPLKNKVIITPRGKLFTPMLRSRGWITQQLCKLMGAAQSKSDWVMILDAKTWFVKPVSEQMLFLNGRAMVITMEPHSGFAQGQAVLEAEHGVSLSYSIGPMGVPYWFHVPTVQSIISEHKDFPNYFMTVADNPTFVTEFLLYSCAVIKNQLFDQLYHHKLSWSPWHIGEGEEDRFEKTFSELEAEHNIITSSIHRNCFNTLSEDQLIRWVSFLHQKDVILDPAEFHQLIAQYRESRLIRSEQS
jgi:hypothetical protein